MEPRTIRRIREYGTRNYNESRRIWNRSSEENMEPKIKGYYGTIGTRMRIWNLELGGKHGTWN